MSNDTFHKTTGVGPSELYLLSVYYFRDEDADPLRRAIWIAAHNSELAAAFAEGRDWKAQGMVFSDVEVRDDWGVTDADLFGHGVDVILRPGRPPLIDPGSRIEPVLANERPDGVEGPLEEGYCQRCGVHECLEHPQVATLLQELDIEAAGVPHRRGQLYRIARQRIIDLQEALDDCIEVMECIDDADTEVDKLLRRRINRAREVSFHEPNND